MELTLWRISKRLTCLLVVGPLIVGGCNDDAQNDQEINAKADVVPSEAHSHDHAHGHDHEHGHSHADGHAHHSHHDSVAVPSRFGGVTARAGDIGAEVVVNASGMASIYLWSTPINPPVISNRKEMDTLEVVSSWVEDAQVFRSTLWSLQLIEEDHDDEFDTRHYVGEFPKKYRQGGEIILIAPIVRINDKRESFDVVVNVPPQVGQQPPVDQTEAPIPRNAETTD